jgi:phage-related tail protein
MNNPETQTEIKMDVNNLYREDTFTDNAVGTLRRLTPVTADGETDPARPMQFVGATQVLTTAGPLPLSFEIEAASLTEAAQAFGDAAKKSFEQTMEELKEMQRQQASSIVVPKSGMDPMGGMGGGGNIQMP